MRGARAILLGAVVVLAGRPAGAQVVFLQNDSYTGGTLTCHAGFDLFEGLGAKFTAAPGQYPLIIDRVRVLGCGGGPDVYGVSIFEDNGPGPAPGALLWSSQNLYQLQGGNVFNDLLISQETPPPPPIASGSVRVFLISHALGNPMGFGADTNGFVAGHNFLFSSMGVWSFADSGGVVGDWILRLGIKTSAPVSADVSVTISDGQTSAVPGQPVTYTIVATNSGPDPVVGARVQAALPPTLVGATWVCTATAGSNCAADGGGSIDDTVGLLVGGSLTYSLNATIQPAAAGSVSYTATVAVPSGATDPVPGNNSATDTDTLTPRGDLAMALTDSPDPVAPGGTLTYTLGVTNLGPSASTGMTLSHTLPAGVSFASSNPGGPTCSHTAGVVTCALAGLLPTASATVTVVATVGAGTPGPLSSTASVTGVQTDPVVANNSDTETTTVSAVPLGRRFYTLPPCRIVDTRPGSGAPIGGSALNAHGPRLFTLVGHCGLPATARAVSLNVTITDPGAPGNLRLYPGGLSLPVTSTVNYSTGQTRANNAVMPLGTSGDITAFADQPPATTVHLIVDVNGYFE